jgi:hypothetical protein
MATVIEQTSKKLKGTLVLCRVGYVIAVFWGILRIACVKEGLASEEDFSLAEPTALFFGAVCGAFVTRFLIWWRHG